MKTYLKNFRVDIWLSVVNFSKVPKTAPTNTDHNNLIICNSKKRHVILSGLTPIVSSKLMACNTTNDVWDKLKIIYEQNPKVN